MTTQVTSANLSVSFQEETDTYSGSIVLEQPSDAQLILHCYSNDSVTYVASVGSIEVMEQRSITLSETLTFNGSSSAALKKPGATSVTIQSGRVVMQQVVNESGQRFIRPSSASLSFDSETNSIIATDEGQPATIYGGCGVTYKVSYQVLRYKPVITSTLTNVVVTIGSVFAYNNSAFASLSVKYNLNFTPDWAEFARVTSKIVLDERGVWEFPPNWESTYQSNKEKSPDQRSEYDTGSFASGHPPMAEKEYEIDPSRSFIDERVHCIVEVNSIGEINYRDFNNGGDDYWAWFTPYFGYNTYDPTYQLTWSDPPGGAKASNAEAFKQENNTLNRSWRNVFLNVNKGEILAKLQIDYPGISQGNKRR